MTKGEMDRAYLEGVAARNVGKPLTVNPYVHRHGRDGDLLWDRWVDGWADRDRGNQADGDD